MCHDPRNGPISHAFQVDRINKSIRDQRMKSIHQVKTQKCNKVNMSPKLIYINGDFKSHRRY